MVGIRLRCGREISVVVDGGAMVVEVIEIDREVR